MRKRDLIDFKEYESRICFTTRQKEKKKKRTQQAWKLLLGKKQVLSDSDDSDEIVDDDSSDEGEPEFTDFDNVHYHDFRYTAATGSATFLNEEEEALLQLRKLSFILNEVLADMGFAKKTHIW